MSTDEIVERVARAIWFREWEDDFPRRGSIEHALARNMARAAIVETLRAVRPLTPKVGEAGVNAFWPGEEMVYPNEHDGPEHAIDAAWQAMIDSLLSSLPI